MKIADPRAAPSPIYARWIATWLNDPRDSEFVGLIGQCLALCAFASALFFMPRWVWYAAPLYWVLLVAGFLDRFTLMLHCTSHRKRSASHVLPERGRAPYAERAWKASISLRA